jgi:hypothetical protein
LETITKQEVDTIAETATIEITSNLVWPYKLVNFAVTSGPVAAGLITTLATPISVQCGDTGLGTSCTQISRFTINTATICSLSGQYQFQWQITCHDLNADVCALGGGESALATLSLVSEDLCADVSITTLLTGALTSFRDLARTTPKSNFFAGQTIYHRVSLTSSEVTLTAVQIQKVSFIPTTAPIDPVDFYLNSVTTPNGIIAAFTVESTTATTALFHFTLNNLFLTNIVPDVGRQYQTSVIVRASFQDVTGKRFVADIKIDDALYSKILSVRAPIEVLAQPTQMDDASLGQTSAVVVLVTALFGPVMI